MSSAFNANTIAELKRRHREYEMQKKVAKREGDTIGCPKDFRLRQTTIWHETTVLRPSMPDGSPDRWGRQGAARAGRGVDHTVVTPSLPCSLAFGRGWGWQVFHRRGRSVSR